MSDTKALRDAVTHYQDCFHVWKSNNAALDAHCKEYDVLKQNCDASHVALVKAAKALTRSARICNVPEEFK